MHTNAPLDIQGQYNEFRRTLLEHQFNKILVKLQQLIAGQKLPCCYIVYPRDIGVDPQAKQMADFLMAAGLVVHCEANVSNTSYVVTQFVSQLKTADKVLILGHPSLPKQYEVLLEKIINNEIKTLPSSTREIALLIERANQQAVESWLVPLQLETSFEPCFPQAIQNKNLNILQFSQPWLDYAAVFDLLMRLLPASKMIIAELRDKFFQQMIPPKLEEAEQWTERFYAYLKWRNAKHNFNTRQQLMEYIIEDACKHNILINPVQFKDHLNEKDDLDKDLIAILCGLQDSLTQQILDHANNNTTRISDEQLFPISTLIKSRLKQRYSTNSRMPLLLYPDHFLPIESYFVNLLIEKTIILKETQDLKEHANNNMQEVTEESWQIPQQDKHFTTKEEISVENILQPGSHQKIVVEGYAGAGKSTLCRHITHRWAEGKLWPHYLAVFYIPLRNLVHYPPEHLNLLSVIRKECLSVQQNELFTDNELNLWLQRHEHEIVYINDGYDEIIAANASPSLIKLLQELMAKPVRIVTSRPNFYQTKFDEVSLQVTGFKDSDITTYVRRFLAKFDAEDKINGLLQLIDQNIHLRQIARVPINLELLCSSWLENRGRVKNSAKMAGITNLYEAIIINLLRHNLQRKNTQDTYQWLLIDIWGHPDSQLILTILSEIAWQSFRDRSLIITKKHYQSALIYLTQYVSGLTNDPKAANAYRQELINNIFRNFGLLRTIGLDTLPLTEREFVFAHASFHEFFAAYCLAIKLRTSTESQDYQEAAAFINRYKYSIKCQQACFFIAGLLRDYNSALDNYFTLLKSEPIDLIGNYALGLQMDCVEEAGAPDYLVKPIIHKVMCEKRHREIFLQKLTGCSKFCQSSLLTIEIKKPIEDFFAKHDSEKMPYAYFNKLIEVVLKGNDGFLNYVFSVLLEDVVHVKKLSSKSVFLLGFLIELEPRYFQPLVPHLDQLFDSLNIQASKNLKKIIQIIGKTICAAGHPKIYIEALVQLLLHEDGKIGEHISQAFLGMCLQGFDWLEHYLEMFWELVKAQPPSLNLGVFMVMLANKDPKNWIVFVENNASSEYDNNVMLCLLTMYENPHNRELFSATMIDKLAMSLIKHGAKGYVIDDTTLATRVLYWLSHLLRSESSYDRFLAVKALSSCFNFKSKILAAKLVIENMDVFTYFMVNYMELRWKIIRCFQYYNPQLENLSAKEFLSSPKVLVDIASTHFRAEFATDMLSKIISQNHELIKPLLLALLEEMSKEKRIVRENRALKDCLRKFASAFVIEMKQMTKGFFLDRGENGFFVLLDVLSATVGSLDSFNGFFFEDLSWQEIVKFFTDNKLDCQDFLITLFALLESPSSNQLAEQFSVLDAGLMHHSRDVRMFCMGLFSTISLKVPLLVLPFIKKIIAAHQAFDLHGSTSEAVAGLLKIISQKTTLKVQNYVAQCADKIRQDFDFCTHQLDIPLLRAILLLANIDYNAALSCAEQLQEMLSRSCLRIAVSYFINFAKLAPLFAVDVLMIYVKKEYRLFDKYDLYSMCRNIINKDHPLELLAQILQADDLEKLLLGLYLSALYAASRDFPFYVEPGDGKVRICLHINEKRHEVTAVGESATLINYAIKPVINCVANDFSIDLMRIFNSYLEEIVPYAVANCDQPVKEKENTANFNKIDKKLIFLSDKTNTSLECFKQHCVLLAREIKEWSITPRLYIISEEVRVGIFSERPALKKELINWLNRLSVVIQQDWKNIFLVRGCYVRDIYDAENYLELKLHFASQIQADLLKKALVETALFAPSENENKIEFQSS